MKDRKSNKLGLKAQRQITFKTIFTHLVIVLVLLSLALGMILTRNTQVLAPTNEKEQMAAAPPDGLTTDEWGSMQELIRQAEYQFTWQESNGVWAYRAPNRAHDLALSLVADGFHAARYSSEGDALWDFGLSLAAYGEQTFPAAIAEDDLNSSRERVEYQWSQEVVEWYINSVDGVEHGLMLAAPPVGSVVELTFALSGSLTPEMDAGGRKLRLKDASGATALLYDQLAVYDASGHPLPAHMHLTGVNLQLVIDDTGAAYPLTVDPILHDQETKLTASDTEDDDNFGWSVAISGDTVVVGAFGEDGAGSGRGAAYVFTRNQDGSADSWGEADKIVATPLQDSASFGRSVAISGDTLVVGAYSEDDLGIGDCVTGEICGVAYIFERNEDGTDMWGQVKRLTASTNAEARAYFGWSVAISGDTVVVGAPFENGFGGDDRGVAYVFSRNTGGMDYWGLVKRLTPSTPQDEAHFGYSVAISGDTLVVGAYWEDGAGADSGAAYLFERNQNGQDQWGQVKKLTASDTEAGDMFGNSVAISGATVVVGAYYESDINNGAAYIFERNKNGTDSWGQVTKLTASDAQDYDYFGSSVAISVNTIVVGARYADIQGGGNQVGAAYVFERNQGGADSWGQLRKLTASDAEKDDYFGNSVAISGNTVVVGAAGEDGDGTCRGAAYLYVAGGGEWSQIALSRATDAENDDRYGFSVAISGDTAIIGAPYEDGTGTDRGAAYIIERNKDGADQWGEVTKLTPSDPGNDDYFGRAVGISGDTAVVGAWGWDGPNGEDFEEQGAAYVFERNKDGSGTTADNWGQVAKLTAPQYENGYLLDEQNDHFGYSVAISGDTIVIGARYEDSCYGSCHDEGAAYIFERNQGAADDWGQVRRLRASDAEDYDNFGASVAISGDTVVVGAWGEDGAVADSDRGAAYVFKRNHDVNADQWGQIAKLSASNPEDDDRFGISVAISNDTIIVGAYQEDGFGGDNRGAAYIFERNKNDGSTTADNWGLVKKLSASDAQDNDYFGRSVSISGDIAVVGAYGEDGIGLSNDDRGAAYVFERNYRPSNPSLPQVENWGEMKKLTASDPANNDFFGYSVAISGDTIVVGAYLEESGLGQIGDPPKDRGAAYIYYRWDLAPEITVSPGSLDFGDQGVNAGPTSSQEVTITNGGDADLHISAVSLSGVDAAEFAIDSDSGEATLTPGSSRTIQVSFDPSSTGVKSANLIITSDDGDESAVDIALSGKGVSGSVSPGDDVWYVYLPLVANDD